MKMGAKAAIVAKFQAFTVSDKLTFVCLLSDVCSESLSNNNFAKLSIHLFQNGYGLGIQECTIFSPSPPHGTPESKVMAALHALAGRPIYQLPKSLILLSHKTTKHNSNWSVS